MTAGAAGPAATICAAAADDRPAVLELLREACPASAVVMVRR